MDGLFRGIIYKADNQIKWALADNGFGDFLESIRELHCQSLWTACRIQVVGTDPGSLYLCGDLIMVSKYHHGWAQEGENRLI